MIRDLVSDTPAEEQFADVCIVGAGAAGIVLALELARQGKTVTLLEGGGRLVEEQSQRPYQSFADALPHRGLHSGRVRALGGTTTLWGGQILALDALDFEHRPWVAGSGWPISKGGLTRYYARALELEGLSRSLSDDAEVWAEVGASTPEFKHLCAYMSRWCPEPNFARMHRRVLEQPNAIQVWLHANATGLQMNGSAVAGVGCRTQEGRTATFRASQYCFCMGAIESSRFFLQPRQGGLPWNASGLLGTHFQDHIDCDAASVLPHSAEVFHDMFDAIYLHGFKYNPKLKVDEDTQRSHRMLNVGATFYSTDERLSQLKTTAKKLLGGRFAELTAADAWQFIRNSPMFVRQTRRYVFGHRAYHAPDAPLKMRVHCEQEPASESAITLGDERDELGLLRTRLLWSISETELRTIRSFVQIARESLATVATIVPDEALSDDRVFRNRCEDSFHHMGGMRMHDSPRAGVVDTNLKLHGTTNAFICSSAVFPTSGFSNPTHTLLALTVRLAEHLAGSGA